MREIKFRAWNKKRNKWMSEYHYSINENGTISLMVGNYDDSSNDIELIQFTGLKDKNGKEIYEGDIIKSIHKLNPLMIKDEFSIVGYSYNQVEFVSGRFIGQPKKWDNEISEYFGKNGIYGFTPNELTKPSTEIIGNIYENPELFK